MEPDDTTALEFLNEWAHLYLKLLDKFNFTNVTPQKIIDIANHIIENIMEIDAYPTSFHKFQKQIWLEFGFNEETNFFRSYDDVILLHMKNRIEKYLLRVNELYEFIE